jgi:N-acetylglucosamine-6-sulfatase
MLPPWYLFSTCLLGFQAIFSKAITATDPASTTSASIHSKTLKNSQCHHDPDQTTTKQHKKKKNILILLTDDQDVVISGMQHMTNVQQYLVQQGTTFTNAFVHTPICCPSRSTMLSGRYLHNGAARNNSYSGNCNGLEWQTVIEPNSTYAIEAQRAGYTTAYAGKYLNQYGYMPPTTPPPPNNDKSDDATDDTDTNDDPSSSSSSSSSSSIPHVPAGWNHWFGLIGNSRYYNYSIVVSSDNGTTSTIQHHQDVYPQDYLPLVLQQYTLELLPTLAEPWLLVVAWPSPHAPFTPEPWAVNVYANRTAPYTPHFNASDRYMQQKHWLLRQLPPITLDEKTLQIDIMFRRRLETLLTVDEHIGQLQQLLSSLPMMGQQAHKIVQDTDNKDKQPQQESSCSSTMWDRTVTIYTSDNGFQFGQHRLAIDKRHLYEFDIRVPLIVRGLDLFRQNYTSHRLVVNVDLAPTIWDLIHMSSISATERDDEDGIAKDDGYTEELMSRVPLPLPDYMDGLSLLRGGTARHSRRQSSHPVGIPGKCPDHHHDEHVRHDFLISYNGEGDPKCGVADCPIPPKGTMWYMPDSLNNTYHCVRTMIFSLFHEHDSHLDNDGASDIDDQDFTMNNIQENSIFCQFEDNENFIEFYNLTSNPHQLDNDYDTLSPVEVQRYKQRLQELKTCQGPSCRRRPGCMSVRP